MKHPSNWIRLLSIVTLFTAVSCNSGEEKKEAQADSLAKAATVAPAPLKDELFVKHKVADFDKWKAAFESGAADRAAAGLQDHIIARGVEDPNTVLIIEFMDDADKAKTFVADPKLKEAMAKAGAISAPEIDYIHRVDTDTTPTDLTARLMVKLKVKDWASWKKVFDTDKADRLAGGLSDRMVGHAVGDDHSVTLVFVVNDAAKAKAMMSSKELGEKMKTSGVEGQPSVFFYTVAVKK